MTLEIRQILLDQPNKLQLTFILDIRLIIRLLKSRWIRFQKATRGITLTFLMKNCFLKLQNQNVYHSKFSCMSVFSVFFCYRLKWRSPLRFCNNETPEKASTKLFYVNVKINYIFEFADINIFDQKFATFHCFIQQIVTIPSVETFY